jgi:hypothetical protein
MNIELAEFRQEIFQEKHPCVFFKPLPLEVHLCIARSQRGFTLVDRQRIKNEIAKRTFLSRDAQQWTVVRDLYSV